MRLLLSAFLICAVLVPFRARAGDGSSVTAPQQIAPWQGGFILLPEGTLKRFVHGALQGPGPGVGNYWQTSGDGGNTWSEKVFAYDGPPANLPLLDQDGEYHVFPMVARKEGEGKTIAVDFFIDVWHVRTTGGGKVWEAPQRIFAGYVGSLNSVMQLRSGRIILPFAEWLPNIPEGPPLGPNRVTCVYSDDGGATWQKSPSQLSAPCYTDFNGSGYGACEPVLLELQDGRVYMLARTETGRLYESWSPDGIAWEPLRPSRFLGTDAPAGLLRLNDGRILLFYNACEKPPRVEGAGVYGGRDALIAAVSEDEGKTWRGFREVYRDPTRNESPQKNGDRGTAYPMPYRAPDGQVLLVSGQGRSGATLRLDPEWLLATHQETDFSQGLEDWSVFTSFGPVANWWQDRRQGPALVAHPTQADAKVLQLRRADDEAGDGAVWNFPMGRKGMLRLRLMLQEGFGGAVISLLDRFFDPTDPSAETEAIFTMPITPAGNISLAKRLAPGAWHDLTLDWDLAQQVCAVAVDGEAVAYLKQAYREPLGINYVRFRSTAEGRDPQGLLLERVSVDIEPGTDTP